jgi:hypothetical protein
VGNIVNIVVHAVSERKEGWWCGEAPAVCSHGLLPTLPW